jgi:hypothetical protein
MFFSTDSNDIFSTEILLRGALESDPKNDVAQFHLGTLLYR